MVRMPIPQSRLKENEIFMRTMQLQLRMVRVGVLLGILFSFHSAWAQQDGNKGKELTLLQMQGQSPTLMLESKLMGRQLPYRVLLPEKYWDKEQSGRKYPVLYLLHGLTGRFDNWSTRTSLMAYAEKTSLIIVTPEGENGWYTDSVTKPNDQHESYIVKELIPEIDKRFRTLANRDNRSIAGLSMGGYGAIKFGLKYPEMFSLVGSFSGALGAATYPDSGRGDASLRSLSTVFGAADSETRKANDIFRIIREATPEQIKAFPFIYFDCGTEDFLFQNNREFVELLFEKKVRHEYRQLPGGHTWPYWDKQVQEFLAVADRNFRNN